MASDIKIVYHNNVFAGSGAPADGDLLTRDNSSHPKDSVYIDRDSGTVYIRKDTTLVAATDWQAGAGGSSSSEYEALISQSGTSAPTIDSLGVNTLGGNPVASRDGAGLYKLTLAGAFPANKTFAYFTAGSAGGANLVFSFEATGDDISFTVGYIDFAGGGVVADDNLLNSAALKIIVRP
jgi:hypothetical protein